MTKNTNTNQDTKKAVDYRARRDKAKAEMEAAKLRLQQLADKRKNEIAELAFKAGLDVVPDEYLETAFKKITEDYHAQHS